MRRCLVTFATLFLLWALVAELNHEFAPHHVYLFVGGLYVAYSALALPPRSGLAATLLAGLMLDAVTPVAFGLHAVLFAVTHLMIFNLRDRIPREETVTRVVVALLANLLIFLVFSFLEVAARHVPGTVWPRLVCDLLCSQVLIALLAPWFFALQAASLALTRPRAAFNRDGH